jgi:hypothetical protein
MIKSGTSTFRSVPHNGHAADRNPTRQTGRVGLEAPAIGHQADAGNAYMRLWEIVNELERKLRSEQRKYPPDQSRIDWLLELETRILFTLLPYERPKLKSIAPPPKPVPEPDLSKLTREDLEALARILPKLGGKDCGAAEIEAPAPRATTNRRSGHGSAADSRWD